MPGSLNGRVRRLENGRVEPCEECGHDGDLDGTDIEVVWEDLLNESDGSAGEVEELKVCGTCGRQLEWIVRWLDLEGE